MRIPGQSPVCVSVLLALAACRGVEPPAEPAPPPAAEAPKPAPAGPPTDADILTPAPPREPRINGPRVYGVRLGRPFLFRIPATGDRPMKFDVKGLPEGLIVDFDSGIVSGRIASPEKTTYRTTLVAANARGRAEREFRIVVGDTLALTPPMGWNHWYTHYDRVTDALMREAADVLVASGMADVGYAYVNIDDCWMVKPGSTDPELQGAERDAEGRINPNRRFPDMKALTDYIHARGLKAGLYTSPGPRTCANFTGTYQHEEQDAKRFAAWGFDFLKYDWCSYGNVAKKEGGEGLEKLKKPYRRMGEILARQERDIVYNLCQYGMGEVWTWGGEVGGHCWRTTGDLGLEKNKRLPGFYSIGLKNAKAWESAKPGNWNDPDYILVGWVGNARKISDPPTYTTLTADEQYSYVSMWCLMAAPLFYSGLMGTLDAFTLAVLCNAEAIEVDQDPLGKQARIVRQTEEELVLAKPMEDGSLAVGLFNLAEEPRAMSAAWAELGIAGPQRARDLWRWRDLGIVEEKLEARVNRHGVSFVRLWPDKGE
jgi:alpha-galactosidase